MSNKLFDLFRDKLSVKTGLVATDPVSLNDISQNEEEQNLILEKISSLETVKLKVDYSDFSNFVYFNSAYDYFNITGEKLLNEYPFDSSADKIEAFKNGLDGYQQYVLNAWPKNVGHLRFNTSISSSYILVDDVGRVDGAQRAGILSPGTGSLSIECWIEPEAALTGSEEAVVIVQKLGSGSFTGDYTLFLSGASVHFSVTSGSTANIVSAPITSGQTNYIAAVLDRSSYTGSLYIATGSQSQFPVIVQSASLNFYGQLNLGSSRLSMASGSGNIAGLTKAVSYFSGSLDDVKIWKKNLAISDMSSSFNVKSYPLKNLYGLWRFNEAGDSTNNTSNTIIIDSSGKSLNGTIQNYYSNLRGSGSLLTQEHPDLILDVESSQVSYFITQNQLTASAYDKNNYHKITDLFPENYIVSEEQRFNTDVMKNFLYIYGRFYDNIRLYINQFSNLLTVNYGDYNQAPDELLDVAAAFFGWEFTGNFLNNDIFQYILGKNVLKNLESNKELEDKLFSIKNEFWKRTLLNLNYIYKTKGTRESIKALLRCYGVNDNFVRIKEFGALSDVGISTERIASEKSVSALGFGSGSLTGSVYSNISSNFDSFTVESRILWPLTSSTNIQATKLSGSIWSLVNGDDYLTLRFERDSLSSHTGTLYLTASDGLNNVSLSSVGIFNSRWQNISVTVDNLSASLRIEARELDDDGDIDVKHTASLSNATEGLSLSGSWTQFKVGATASFDSEYWMQEVRVWNRILSNTELDDHTLNYQSFGTENVFQNENSLFLNWSLNENSSSDANGNINSIFDYSLNSRTGQGVGFAPLSNSYKKFLNRYNYIASLDFSWSENKIRTFEDSKVDKSYVNDDKVVSVEFNMIDALNEDITKLMSSLEELNERIGFPVNKHRVNYDELEILRNIYFERLEDRLNFTKFSDLLEFFDRSFMDMIRKLIPARANFIGDEFIVESHMLERPKITWEKRRNQQTEFSPLGIIEMWTRFGVNDDKSGRKFPLFLSGSI